MTKIYWLVLLIMFSSTYAQSPVPEGAELELIANGFQFVEGPVWNDTLGLLFSDLSGNKIYRWTEEDSISVFLNPSANSNGLTYNLDGYLIIAQTGLRRVARRESNGDLTPLAVTYNGKKLNSPNDLAVKSDGSIFFTDPDFNIPQGQQRELNFKGIYRINAAGSFTLLDSTFDKPNGICFSPDESRLYVNESPNGKIYVWDVINDSTISNKQLFYAIPLGGYADGMKVDSDGNLYCTGPTGVWIISPTGEFLDKIAMPQGASNPSNCNWGDEDRKTLYITAGNSVYRIRLATTSGTKDRGENLPLKFKLYQNYPNPFNPNTTIRFTLKQGGFTKLEIFNELGSKIKDLINQYLKGGNHDVEFNASDYASGVYYYKLASSNFTSAGKMIYLK